MVRESLAVKPSSNTPKILLNCTVEVDGLESEWSYLKQFGFIHPRELEGCVSDDDELFHQVYQYLVPNGPLSYKPPILNSSLTVIPPKRQKMRSAGSKS